MKKKKDQEEALESRQGEEKLSAEEKSSEQEEKDLMEEDVALFRSLFPDVKGDEIPVEVWEGVEAGQSLCAAYALWFVKDLREKEKVEQFNAENEKKAPPRIRQDGGEYDYFSPEAVKEMTPAQIKKHYRAILRSMDSWN